MNDKPKYYQIVVFKDTIVIQMEVLSGIHLQKWRKRHEIPQSKCPVARPRFESGTSQIHVSFSAG